MIALRSFAEDKSLLGRRSPFDWEVLASQWRKSPTQGLWRRYSDSLNTALLLRWLAPRPNTMALKTDLFDEAFGDGVYPALGRCATRVIGLDISRTVALAAKSRYDGLEVIGADVRQLPFDEAVFDIVLSNSSIDHFDSQAELEQCLAELYRVLRPGGELVITLDNPTNPIIRIRNFLPFQWVNRIGLVPYYVGATYSAAQLSERLSRLGMEVVESSVILHFPRVLAVPLTRIAHKLGTGMQRWLLSVFRWFECLERLPTRKLTGHFVAVLARRPEDGASDVS